MNSSEYKNFRKLFGEKSIDELIELLFSEDLQTRFFAEMSLRDATGV